MICTLFFNVWLGKYENMRFAVFSASKKNYDLLSIFGIF